MGKSARKALMLVHSFSKSNKWFDDYDKFLSMYNTKAGINQLVYAKNIDDVDLYFAWVKGNETYLSK